MHRKIVWTIPLLALMLWGCAGEPVMARLASQERKDQGLIIILPGIEGESRFNHDIRDGLADAGVKSAIMIYRWGRPVPLAGMLLNQVDILGNRAEARKIARMIEQYQDEYPGRSVQIIGHSGGGGVGVFVCESLSPRHQVDGLILLSASISPSYDLTRALARCRSGIVNFYSTSDVGLLMVATTIAGNVDGVHGPAAGANGFAPARPSDPAEKLQAYSRLWQVRILDESASAHVAATQSRFVEFNVAPWVQSDHWPALEVAGAGNSPISTKPLASRAQ